MNEFRQTIQAQQKAIETRQEADELAESTAKTPQSWWQRQMLAQGPWDEISHPAFVKAFKRAPKPLKDPPSLPMSMVNRDQESPDKSISHLERCDIPRLLAYFGNNGFVRHVLLENNIIGFSGAAALAHWVLDNPGSIETWFLASSSIDAMDFQRLVDTWIFADNVTNIWLSRNPMDPESAYMLSVLIKNSPKLRALDLDQTGTV